MSYEQQGGAPQDPYQNSDPNAGGNYNAGGDYQNQGGVNPYGAQPAANDPGQGMGKIGMILAIIPCTAFIGLILSIIAFFQSKNAGFQNKNARIGIIVGIVWIVISVIINIISYSMQGSTR